MKNSKCISYNIKFQTQLINLYKLQFGRGWDAHGGFNHPIIAGISLRFNNPGRNLQLARYCASTAGGFLVLARCSRNTRLQTARYWHHSKR